MPDVINPFAGRAVGFTWAQHVAAYLTGGTDYIVPAGVPVVAAMSGVARALGVAQLNAVSITAPNGLVVSVRELRSQTGKFPRTVKQGEQIGVTGLFRDGETRWPHIDANRPSDGKRVPFEPYIGLSTASSTSTPLDPSGAGLIIQRRRKGNVMYTHFSGDAALTKAGGVPVVYAAFTDANGQGRLRVCGTNEAAIAYAGGLSIPADAGTIDGLGNELGYSPSAPHAVLVPQVSATVDLSKLQLPAPDLSPVLTAIAAVPAAVVNAQGAALSNG